jgi:hypothetical protein
MLRPRQMPILFSRQVQPAYICLPSLSAECGTRNFWHFEDRGGSYSALRVPHSALKLAARVGLAPTPNGLTGRRATLTLPGNKYLALAEGLPPSSPMLEASRSGD